MITGSETNVVSGFGACKQCHKVTFDSYKIRLSLRGVKIRPNSDYHFRGMDFNMLAYIMPVFISFCKKNIMCDIILFEINS